MARDTHARRWSRWVLAAAPFLLLVGIFQVWSAIETRNIVRDAIAAPVHGKIEEEKNREEAIAKRIENRSKELWLVNLASSLAALAGLLISGIGAALAVSTYFSGREKERLDRLSTALSDALERLVAEKPRQRMVGAAGLLPFLASDMGDFHLQALSALVAAARLKDDSPEARQNLRLVIERAVRVVAPEVLRAISWQGVRLAGINMSGCDLSGLDLRDAELIDARLAGADLARADLTAAKLQGARLDRARLTDATLSYADLAGADVGEADLSGARLDGVKVSNLALAGARFCPPGDGWRAVPWDAARDWRAAAFDTATQAELARRYGSAAPKLHVVMLMWEAPPFVVGGAWTACYHLVRRLRRRGADVTIVIPWERARVDDNPFGIDVPIVGLGIEPPQAIGSGYGGASRWSAYGRAAMPGAYGAGPGLYGAYGAYGSYDLAVKGSTLFRLVGDFRRRLRDILPELRPDLVHAHDWVTFFAAREGARLVDVPWIAHFHSTEIERRPDAPDPLIAEIERDAVASGTGAGALIVPGEASREALIRTYGPDGERAEVMPNLLSEEPLLTSQMGQFETGRVVFTGRLSPQKGLDRFASLANHLQSQGLHFSYDVYGEGEEYPLASRYPLRARGRLDWRERKRAFAGASVVVVPSRAEPFGMVVLEAMQQRVPVLYPRTSGAADALASGIKVDPEDISGMATEVARLMSDLGAWEKVVRDQAAEIDGYSRRDDDDRLMEIWKRLAPVAPGTDAGRSMPARNGVVRR